VRLRLRPSVTFALRLKTAVEERGLRARRRGGICREPEGFLGLGLLDKLFVVVVSGTEVVVARATVFGRGAFESFRL
jgi:hypothetical protein